MAKIIRKKQEIFCNVAPTGKLGVFGSYAAGAPAYSNDVETLQESSAYGSGLSGALINNAPPAIQDFDGLFYMLTTQIAYLLETGIPEYNAETEYAIGSLVSVVGQIFISVTNLNTGNDISDQANWVIYKTNKVIRYTGDLAMASYDDYIVELDGSEAGGAGTLLFILPAPTTNMSGRIIVVKNLYPTGSGYVQVQAADSSIIDDSATSSLYGQYTRRTFICTGTRWDSI